MKNYVDQEEGVFSSVCPLDCPDQCGLLLHKAGGRIVKVEGDPDHPVTEGHICNKVRNMPHRLYDEKRLKHPLRRTGPKGSGQFERISWEEAIQSITGKWQELMEDHGSESILPYSFYGNMGNLSAEGMDRRFFNRLGASSLERSICNSAGAAGYTYTMGGSIGTDPEETVHAKLFIFWGVNAVSTNMHQVTLAQKARKNGAKIVVIDVHRNRTAKWADWFIPILPGTDAALALGIMHLLFKEGLCDIEFLEQYTVGWKDLKDHVRQYDPESVSAITGVPAEDIYKLARMYGSTSPSFIRIGNGPQHHDNGGMCIRTISCLPALTGQWLKKGGGAIKGNSAFLAHNSRALQRPELMKKKTRSINMNAIGKALLEASGPRIHSLFVYSSNPAVVAPEGNKVREGLLREDLFTVVHDLFLTETALYADIILPAASSFENTDFYTSYWHHYIQLQKPVVHPYYESKSNTEVFRLLSRGMGFNDDCLQETDEELIRQALDNPDNPHVQHISYEALSKQPYIKADRRGIFPETLPTPSGRIELYSRKMERDGYPALPTYMPLPEESFPLLFVPAPNHNFLNSTFSNNERHIGFEKVPLLYMHRDDAVQRGIEDGDKIVLWNGRGECTLTVSVGQDVLPGAVVSLGLWSDIPGTNQLVNSLTPDRIADMGGGAVFFSGKVDVKKAE
ncbi:molybdopterin-dependent oxidoreductase [Peribacillus sp. SCS-37]|uniref:molybdopterin-dependent oxidoreductase n=1 Tax=Paraperibacillus esterisolvens TaxID=3115296 RepID=UPI003906128C